MTFTNREEAGKMLGHELAAYTANAVVLAIPRGGVVVGFEVANYIHAPLSIISVRKIGSPWNKEFAIGAISEFQTLLLDEETIRQQNIPDDDIKLRIREEKAELKRRIHMYRPAPLPSLEGKNVIVVDDGLATGLTAKAAIMATSNLKPRSIIFASPVCSADALQDLLTVVDNVVCLLTPPELESIGEWYQSFSSVSDEEVISLLQKSHSYSQHHHRKSVR